MVLLLGFSVSVSAITQEELLNGLISVSASLKKYADDIETLTNEYKADSLEQNMRLDNLDNRLNVIEKGSEDMNQLDPEFELQLKNLTSSFKEYKRKELTRNIVQWSIITILSAYIAKDVWDNTFN